MDREKKIVTKRELQDEDHKKNDGYESLRTSSDRDLTASIISWHELRLLVDI